VLASTVVALLAVRLVLLRPTPLAGVAGTMLLAGWITLLVLSGRRASTLAAPVPPPLGRAVPVLALVTVGFAGAGLALVATP